MLRLSKVPFQILIRLFKIKMSLKNILKIDVLFYHTLLNDSLEVTDIYAWLVIVNPMFIYYYGV
jgi:hypothetical protein